MDKPNARVAGLEPLEIAYPFESPWFNVRSDRIRVSGGSDDSYTYVERPPSVFIVPFTKDRNVVLIHSYRYPIDDWCWEAPAGTAADNTLAPAELARKELLEETGYDCDELLSLGEFHLGNGHSDHIGHFYAAIGARKVSVPKLERLEFIAKVEEFSPAIAWERLCSGARDGDSVFAFLLAARALGLKGADTQ